MAGRTPIITPLQQPSVAIMTPAFFPVNLSYLDRSGCNWGGGERYALDLARLCQRLGVGWPTIFQPSSDGWVQVEEGVPFCGVGRWGRAPFEFVAGATAAFAVAAQHFTHKIYFNPDVGHPAREGELLVTHGVYWDQQASGCWSRHDPAWRHLMEEVHRRPAAVVSVDTNSINWVRAVLDFDLASKMYYIPNYADENLFPTPNLAAGSRWPGRTRILFPRRLVYNRGVAIAIALARELLPQHPTLDFRFVGKGLREYRVQIESLCHQFPDRCTYTYYEGVGIEREYYQADIVLIPTLDCEGTSLSCIEAMAAGCAIVACHPGGIGNLIQDGFSGLLADPPSVDAVRDSVYTLLADPKLQAELGKAARQVFLHAFTKARWAERWTRVFTRLGWV
ncbi:MAG TPA: glycosyltransferase family 4 protein [Bacillota bacterium]|nr:glycosyltransferase family 4 protein [Bacillota bacterium]